MSSLINKVLSVYHRYSVVRARKRIMRSYDKHKYYLNVGSGMFLKDNWRLLDYSDYSKKWIFPPELLDININLIEFEKLPIPDNSVDLIYCSHCLEHLTEASSNRVVEECYRILKPGGIFRISVPDIDLFYNAYVKKELHFFEKLNNQKDKSSIVSRFLDSFTTMKVSEIDEKTFDADVQQLSKRDFFSKYIPTYIDWAKHDFSCHINWFNYDKLDKLAKSIGYSTIIRSESSKSSVPEMRSEQFDITQKHTSLYVELIK